MFMPRQPSLTSTLNNSSNLEAASVNNQSADSGYGAQFQHHQNKVNATANAD